MIFLCEQKIYTFVMERVSALEGDLPVLVIVPHGGDDSKTALIAEIIHRELDAFAVINRGWKMSTTVDHWKDKANCNNILHINNGVLEDEFLKPIVRFVYRINKLWGRAQIYILHGASNNVRKEAGDMALDLVIGYGAGRTVGVSRFSCDPRMKDAFIHYLTKSGFCAYEGAGGGKYSAIDKRSINQLFRHWYYNPRVHSMQIEILEELRESNDAATLTAMELASCMEDLIDIDDSTEIYLTPKKV